MKYLLKKDPDIEIIKVLIESGVNVNKLSVKKATPLYIVFEKAPKMKNVEIIMQLLIQHTNQYIKSISFLKYLRSEYFNKDTIKIMLKVGLKIDELSDSKG